MAKIFPHYSLCPLIEQKNFLGLTQDADPDTVLVTANSNVIGRYKVSEPKQISSWNSKGTITCATVYDKHNDQYVAIFNYNEIRIWTLLDENIDKIKKYKFSEKLVGLLISPRNGKILVVFEKGNVLYLEKAIEIRKDVFPSALIKDEEKLISFEVVYLAEKLITIFLVSTSRTAYRLFGIDIDNSNNIIFNDTFGNAESKLLGHCVLVDKYCYLLSIWSDGLLIKDCIYPTRKRIAKTFLTVCAADVVMKVLSPYYIAINGAKDNGIVLIIYSVKYNLIQCKQFYNNCYGSSQMWNFESKLFFIMGHNLVVVPFVQENRKLSTLIGSSIQKCILKDKEIFPENEICDNLLLELMEKNDNEGVVDIINNYCDIRDCTLMKLLAWSVKQKELHENILHIILNKYSLNAVDGSMLRSFCTENESLYLLDYIINEIPLSQNNVKLLRWISLLIDAFYPQYIMSSNKSVVKKLNEYLIVLKNECEYLYEFKELASVAYCMKRKKAILC
ncbi:hypothetical protein PGB90_001957 [Kerria lacca]